MKKLILTLLLLCSFSPAHSEEEKIYIKVGEAQVKKSLMALPPFLFTGSPPAAPNFRTVGSELYNTVLNDLDSSGYFQFIKQEAYLEDTSKVGLRPAPGEPNGFSYDNWKKIGSEFLIRAGYTILNNQITLEAYLYSVTESRNLIAKKYTGTPTEARAIAHTFANEIIFKLSGKKGYFLSKVVVASDRGNNNFKEIFILDWDGQNFEKLTNHKSIALSPNWSPSGKTIVYTAFAFHEKAKVRNADLFTYELDSKKRFLISSRKGINSGAAYTPDGKNILVTLSESGNPDIYRMSEDGESLKRITNGPAGAMNIEPTVSPDGTKIAFSSDRSGRPMIYIMNIDGSNIKRVTFAGRYNASPAWSPDGKKIAFAGHDKDHFDIFIMDADGNSLERLTAAKKSNGRASNNEDPSFSPDGRQIMFTSDRTGTYQIYTINIDGTNERRITADKYNYFKPKWFKAP